MVLGLLLFYFGGGKAFPAVDQAPAGMVLLVFLWSLTLIPLPPSMDIRGWQETSPLDGTAWTLQWEYLVNLLYAFVVRHLNKLWLTVCVVLFGLLTINLTQKQAHLQPDTWKSIFWKTRGKDTETARIIWRNDCKLLLLQVVGLR